MNYYSSKLFKICVFVFSVSFVYMTFTLAKFNSKDTVSENQIKVGYWVKPSVEVKYPNGGESFTEDEKIKIKWNATSSDPSADLYADIYFSKNSGSTYEKIKDNLKNDTEYEWTIPQEDSSTCLIKVKITDSNDLIESDESDKVFEIKKIVVEKSVEVELEKTNESSPSASE